MAVGNEKEAVTFEVLESLVLGINYTKNMNCLFKLFFYSLLIDQLSNRLIVSE